jgi:UDP-N-acetylglucosamine diphosphorylase/glucosamine-1-phosphate N-acetyltransferase
MKLILFEDESTYNFYPLTLTHATFELRHGIFTFSERAKISLHADVDAMQYLARDYLASRMRDKDKNIANEPEKIDEEAVFVNGLLLVTPELAKLMSKARPGTVGLCGDRMAFAKFGTSPSVEVAKLLMNAPGKEAVDSILSMSLEKANVDPANLISNYWEVINTNSEQLTADLRGLHGRKSKVKAKIVGKASNLIVGKDCEVGPNVVLDVRKAPIFLGDKSIIHPFTWIEGPTYIGSETIIHPSSVIREGSNIGKVCRIGGEVEETVVLDYSNKPHAGFLGHAYIGEWVNLGAMFTNSDLKNTYGTVKVTVRGKKVDSGTRKLGCMVGDHSKGSIGSLLYTGKKVGVCCQIHGTVEEDIPSFTFYGKSVGYPTWEILPDPVIQTVKTVMSRRRVEMTEADEKMLREVFSITQSERDMLNPGKGPFKFG